MHLQSWIYQTVSCYTSYYLICQCSIWTMETPLHQKLLPVLFSIGAVIISTVKDIWYIPKMYFLHPTSLVDRKIIASLKCLGFFIFLFLYNHFKFTSSQIHNFLNLSIISSTENFFVNHICVHLIITIFSSFLLQSWKKDHWVVVEFSILVGSRSTIYLKIFTYQYM